MLKKYDEKLELKAKQIEKLQNEYNLLQKKRDEEFKKIRNKQEKAIGSSVVKYIEKELNRPIDDNESEQIVEFLKTHDYL